MRVLKWAIAAVILGGFSFFVIRHIIWSRRGGTEWYIAAQKAASEWAQDSELILMEGDLITPDGIAQKQGYWRFVFQSKARFESRVPPTSPIPGAPVTAARSTCRYEFKISPYFGRGGLIASKGPSGNCRKMEAPLGPPRCPVKEVWNRAIKLGAPNPGWADISYVKSSDGSNVWAFVIQDRATGGPKPIFSANIPDDCK